MAINLERFVKAKRFTEDHVLDDASDQILVKVATDSVAGKVALNAGTSLPADATNCTDALTACGLNALLTDPAAGGNTVINNIKALAPSAPDATDTVKGIAALNSGTSLPGDATNCTDALTACGLNALLADATVGGNAVINGVKALIPLATTTVAGLIEEATGEETRLGATDANRADRAVTPESMSYALQTGKNYFIYNSATGPNNTAAIYSECNNSALTTTGNAEGAGSGVISAIANRSTVLSGSRLRAMYALVSQANTFQGNAISMAVDALTYAGSDGGIHYGVYAKSANVPGAPNSTQIGVYGAASNGATNWAGYFDGNTYTSGFAGFQVSSPKAPIDAATINGAAIWVRDNGSYSSIEFVSADGLTLQGQIQGRPTNLGINLHSSAKLSIATGGGTELFNVLQAGGATSFGSMTAASYITSSDSTLKENVEDIDAAKALQFRNGLQWKKYEMFSEQQVQIMQDVTSEVQKTDAAGNPVVDADGNPVMETVTTKVPTGRYEVKRNSQGIKRGLIAQEVQALAASIGDFSDVVVEVGEYFTLDAQGYPVKDAQGNNIVNKRLGLDYDAIQFVICAGEQSLLPAVV